MKPVPMCDTIPAAHWKEVRMNTYWAIARSEHWGGDTSVKKIEAASDDEAIAEGSRWQHEDLGFDWQVVVARQLNM